MGKTLTRKKPGPSKQSARPVSLRLTVFFGMNNRKITPLDLEKASIAAAAAFRSSLEARSPAYDVVEIEGQVDYSYLMSSKRFTA